MLGIVVREEAVNLCEDHSPDVRTHVLSTREDKDAIKFPRFHSVSTDAPLWQDACDLGRLEMTLEYISFSMYAI